MVPLKNWSYQWFFFATVIHFLGQPQCSLVNLHPRSFENMPLGIHWPFLFGMVKSPSKTSEVYTKINTYKWVWQLWMKSCEVGGLTATLYTSRLHFGKRREQWTCTVWRCISYTENSDFPSPPLCTRKVTVSSFKKHHQNGGPVTYLTSPRPNLAAESEWPGFHPKP